MRDHWGSHRCRTAVGSVVIAFIADERRVDVINFGHEGPLVLGPRGVRRLPQEENPPLGLAELTGAGPAGISRVLLEPGETVLLVTDGVTEARDRHGHFFLSHPGPKSTGPPAAVGARRQAHCWIG